MDVRSSRFPHDVHVADGRARSVPLRRRLPPSQLGAAKRRHHSLTHLTWPRNQSRWSRDSSFGLGLGLGLRGFLTCALTPADATTARRPAADKATTRSRRSVDPETRRPAGPEAIVLRPTMTSLPTTLRSTCSRRLATTPSGVNGGATAGIR